MQEMEIFYEFKWDNVIRNKLIRTIINSWIIYEKKYKWLQ